MAKITKTNAAMEHCVTKNTGRIDGDSLNLETLGDAFHSFIVDYLDYLSEFSFPLVTGLFHTFNCKRCAFCFLKLIG